MMQDWEEFGKALQRWNRIPTGMGFTEWLYALEDCEKIHVCVDKHGEVLCDPNESFQFALKCDKFKTEKPPVDDV